jgi:hypothetical protein
VLGKARAPEAFRGCIRGLAERTGGLLGEAAPLARQVENTRLALEISIIHRLAAKLTARLQQRDPLSERVHLSGGESALPALLGMGQAALGRLARRSAAGTKSGDQP